MSKIWNIVRGYIWWTYKRGSLHYDVMVSLILLFIFLSPRFLNFGDTPARTSPHQTEVIVQPNGERGFIYLVDGNAVNPSAPESSLMTVIEPIAGEVAIERYEAQKGRDGHVQTYKVWVRK